MFAIARDLCYWLEPSARRHAEKLPPSRCCCQAAMACRKSLSDHPVLNLLNAVPSPPAPLGMKLL